MKSRKIKKLLLALIPLAVLQAEAWTLDQRGYLVTSIPGPDLNSTWTLSGPDTATTQPLEVGYYPYITIGLFVIDSCSIDSIVLTPTGGDTGAYTRKYYNTSTSNSFTLFRSAIADKETSWYSIALPPCSDIKLTYYMSASDTAQIKNPVFASP